ALSPISTAAVSARVAGLSIMGSVRTSRVRCLRFACETMFGVPLRNELESDHGVFPVFHGHHKAYVDTRLLKSKACAEGSKALEELSLRVFDRERFKSHE